VAFGPARQKQRRPQRIAIRRRKRDIVDEYVVQPRLGHPRFPPSVSRFGPNKCEFGFCRKGLTGQARKGLTGQMEI
jgi:hypothetical protein